jgi:hypothetical protein
MYRYFSVLLTALIGLLLFGCSVRSVEEPEPIAQATQESSPKLTVNLEDYGEAPELTNEVWLNTDTPLRLSGLRGKVVLIDFWTFG